MIRCGWKLAVSLAMSLVRVERGQKEKMIQLQGDESKAASWLAESDDSACYSQSRNEIQFDQSTFAAPLVCHISVPLLPLPWYECFQCSTVGEIEMQRGLLAVSS